MNWLKQLTRAYSRQLNYLTCLQRQSRNVNTAITMLLKYFLKICSDKVNANFTALKWWKVNVIWLFVACIGLREKASLAILVQNDLEVSKTPVIKRQQNASIKIFIRFLALLSKFLMREKALWGRQNRFFKSLYLWDRHFICHKDETKCFKASTDTIQGHKKGLGDL